MSETDQGNRALVDRVVTRHCEVWDVSSYDLPQEFRENPTNHPCRCPKCHGLGMWRRGQEFDHMMRCGKCDVVWTPNEVVRLQEAIADELAFCFGGGI